MNKNKQATVLHYCELCDGLGDGTDSRYDTDLCMWLCGPCFNSFNGIIEDVDFGEEF